MTAIALTPEGEAFLARVRDELADLPPDERDELLEDIESHLAEVAGEGEVALAARLGSAEEFAQELRNSAGLPPRVPVSDSRVAAARARLDELVTRGRSLRPHLRPSLLWRLARGWLLAVAVALVLGTLGHDRSWSYSHTWLPHPGVHGAAAVVVLAAFVGLSFWLARRAAAGHGVRLDRAASALALVAIVPAFGHLDSPPREYVVSYVSIARPPIYGLAFDGVRVRNLFPFDRNGKPLEDVLLYLTSGQPLDLNARTTDLNRRYLVTRNGQRLYNSFPVRFFNPGTKQISTGWLRPSTHIPVVVTPPIGSHAP